ncbi:MAG: glycosyltransferase family 2 protein [Gemmatimonadota bacterium]
MRNTVSVLITAHDAAATITQPLRALARQSLRPGTRLEIVVVDDRSTDETLQLARAAAPPGTTFRRIDAHHDPRRTARVAALHCALEASTGDVVLVLDADATPPPEWVADSCRALASSPLVSWPIAFGAAAPTTEARLVAAMQTADNALYLGVCDVLARLGLAAGCCFGAAAVRRELLERVGGFAALPFTLTEDLAFARAAHRIGARMRVGRGTRVVVAGAATFHDFVTRAVRAGTGGGFSALAAVLTLGVATLPLLVALAAFGLVGWPVVAMRWGAGAAFTLHGLARARSLEAAWASLVLEPVAIVVAVCVWRRSRTTRAVAWGGVSYARVDALARGGDSA